MPRVTKAALVARLVEQGLTKRQAERTVAAIIEEITDALARGEDVALRGFGSFRTRHRPFRWCQIPRDGEIVRIEAHNIVSFRPSQALKRATDTSPDDLYFDAIFARRRPNTRELLSKPDRDLNAPVYDMQFDLGIAYREMGLTTRAVERFSMALGLLDEGDRGTSFVQCCYMLGLCNKDLGEPEAAVEWFRNALAAPRRPQAERLEFHYQLGIVLASYNHVRDALHELLQVQLVNPGFRQVQEYVYTLRELRRAQLAAEASTKSV